MSFLDHIKSLRNITGLFKSYCNYIMKYRIEVQTWVVGAEWLCQSKIKSSHYRNNDWYRVIKSISRMSFQSVFLYDDYEVQSSVWVPVQYCVPCVLMYREQSRCCLNVSNFRNATTIASLILFLVFFCTNTWHCTRWRSNQGLKDWNENWELIVYI